MRIASTGARRRLTVLAIGKMGDRGTSLGIVDTVERRPTNVETNDQLFAYTARAGPGGLLVLIPIS